MCRSKDVMPIIRTRKAVTQHGIGRIEKYHSYKKHVQNSRALEIFDVFWVKRAHALPFKGVELCPQILKNFHDSGEHLGILF